MSRRPDGEVATEIRHLHDDDPTNPGLLISIGEDLPESSAAVRSSAVVREVPDPAAGLRGLPPLPRCKYAGRYGARRCHRSWQRG